MYDQRWADDWVESEFTSTCKDYIFDGVLAELARRLPPSALTLALTRCGFGDVAVRAGARVHTPLAFNLQAFTCRR